MATPSSPTSEDSAARGRSSSHRTVKLALVGLLIVAALAVAWDWRRSPDVFGAQGNEVGGYNQVGTTDFIGIAGPFRHIKPGSVTLHSVEPQIVSGQADVDVLVCHRKGGATGIGAVSGSVDDFCESTTDPDEVTLRPLDQLILKVHSDKPVHIVVNGIKVTYSSGWQRGSQVTGMTADLTFGTETVSEHLEHS